MRLFVLSVSLLLAPACFDWRALSAGDAGADGGITPHPAFAALAANTALDLGRYECADRVDPALSCASLSSAKLIYDPKGHRMLRIGTGGNDQSARTDVEELPLTSTDGGVPRWRSLYPSMTCAEMADAGPGPFRGVHPATGHARARGVNDLVALAGSVARREVMVLTSSSYSNPCDTWPAGGDDGVVGFNLSQLTWAPFTVSQDWYTLASAEEDPVSGKVLISGANSQAGAGGMWVVDPDTHAVLTFVGATAANGLPDVPSSGASLVYFPPRQSHFYFSNTALGVYEVFPNRDEWRMSRAEGHADDGGTAPGRQVMAYDSLARVFAGSVTDGVIHRFDPQAFTWSSQTMKVRSTAGASMGSMVGHLLDYDPVDDVFIFLADGPDGLRTWAYRP